MTVQAIRNLLRSARLHARRPYRGPVLTRFHRGQRLWSLVMTEPEMDPDWNTVVFSDEVRLTLTFADGRVRMWRRRGGRNGQ